MSGGGGGGGAAGRVGACVALSWFNWWVSFAPDFQC